MRAATNLAVACVLAATVPAIAQTNQLAATAQFDRGRAMMKQKNYVEACKAFENSQKLDPQLGTLFNLADCHAHLGKLATAWLEYRDLAQRDTNAGRKKESTRRAKDLDRRMPKLVIELASPPAGLAVTINGDDATRTVGIESPIDLGPLAIRATAPGYAPFETTKTAVEGKTIHVAIELAKGGARDASATTTVTPPSTQPTTTATTATATTEPAPIDESHREGSHRKRNGAIIAIAGGGLLVTGTVFGLRARTDWDNAQTLCPNQQCGTADERARGDSLVNSARTSANVATGFVIAGVAVAAVGIYYAVTGKPESSTASSLRLAPTSGGAMVGLGGQF